MSDMEKLSTAEQQTLRARAHALSAVVMISDKGLSDTVLKEIDRNLTAHELVKIRVFSDGRPERDAFLAEICAKLNAAPVQHIGKILVVFRKRPVVLPPAKVSAKPEPVLKTRAAKRPLMAARIPQAEPASNKGSASSRERANTRRRKI